MKKYLIIYKNIAKQTLLYQLQYRVTFFSWLVGKILEPLIFMVVWLSVVRSNGGTVNNLTYNYFIKFYLILMVVSQFTFTYLIWYFGIQIQNGSFSNKLLLPLHPIHYDIAENIGYKVYSLPVIIISAVIISFLFKIHINTSLIELIIFFPILVLSFLLRFFTEWTIALCSFWFVNTIAINQIYYLLLLFFSGRVAPIKMFPNAMQNFIKFLPFRFMISFPVEVLISDLNYKELILFTIVQLSWIFIIIILLIIIWKISIKKYTAVGL